MEDHAFRWVAGTGHTVVVAVRDPGAARFMLPVIEQLKKKDYTVVLVLSGWALKNVHEFSGFAQPASSETSMPDVVVRTSADLRNGGLHALPESLEKLWRDAYFLDIDDAPGSSDRIVMNGRRAPDEVAVFSALAKTDLLESRSDLTPAQVSVTGNPDFDQFAARNSIEERRAARGALSVTEDEFLVMFPGQLEPVASYILEHTVNAINALQLEKPIVFFHTNHPRATEAERALFSDILKRLSCRVIDWKGASGNLGYGADLVMHTHSTEGLKAVFRSVPVVVLGFPETFTYDYMEAYPRGKPPFQVRSGAGFWVPEISDFQESVSVFRTAIQDDQSRLEMINSASAAFNADGQATARVVSLMERASLKRKSGGTGFQTGQTL